jgi:hypothetical protein
MKKAIIAIVLTVAGTAGAALIHAQDADPGSLTTEPVFDGLTRTVSGNDLVSNDDPSVVLRFGPEFRYVGGQKFVLYGVADGEQHPSDFAYARLVHLTDDTRREELMIIFVENLEETYGVTAADLVEGGAKASQRAAVEQAHIDRVRRTLEVVPR